MAEQDEPKSQQPESRVRLRVTNPTGATVHLRIDPWGRDYELPPGETQEVALEGPTPADIEVAAAPGKVTVYGWVGSQLAGEGPPVPRTPYGMSVREWIALVFGDSTPSADDES